MKKHLKEVAPKNALPIHVIKMLGRTHELGAVSALIATDVLIQPHVAGQIAAISIVFALIGGLSPDLDSPTSLIYKKIPAGSFIGRLIHPIFLGGHRHLSHSILGFVIFGYLLKYLLNNFSTFPIHNQNIFIASYLIGFASHIFLDSLTKEGIPLFFPLPLIVSFPPIKKLRVKTGGLVEHLFVVPILLIFIFYFIFLNPKVF